VDIGGHPGSIVSGRDGWTTLTWGDGTHSYELSGIGASDQELVATAASIRLDDSASPPHVEAQPAPGWKQLTRAWPLNPSASFIYTSDDSRVLAVSVFKDAAGLAGDLAPALSGGQPVEGDGARGVAVASGDWTTTIVAIADDALVQVDSLAVAEPDVLRAAGSIRTVSADAWNAAPVAGLHVYPYQPAPGGFVPLVASGGVTLEGHAGPNGSWCLRVVPAPAASSSGCFVEPGPSSVTTTSFTTPTHVTGRAVFGLTQTTTPSVRVELADGTAVDAEVVHTDDPQRCAWLAVVPAGASIRAIQATRDDGTSGWRAGRPVRSS
jgi:hypothetical protein